MSRHQPSPGNLRERLEDLVFRRQFVLGPGPFTPTPRWQTLALGHLILSAHPDLEVVSQATGAGSLTLLGFIVDPFSPARTSAEIVQVLAEGAASLEDLLRLCEPLAGRFVLIWQNQGEFFLFTDPCGFRQVYYCTAEAGSWCGSQPEIIKAAAGLEPEDDEELLAFMVDPEFAHNESSWVGDRTPYKNCRLLLPNHYLKMGAAQPVRFFPAAPLEAGPLAEIIDAAIAILRGSLAAVAHRAPVMLPVTSGYDSRVLLAASRNLAHRIEYYIDRKGVLSENHPDIWLPRRMAQKLGLPFTVRNSQEDLPGWFIARLVGNVTGARVLPKTRMIYAHFLARETRLNLNGNGSEICRNHYEIYHRIEPDKKTVTLDDLARCLCYPHVSFVKTELTKWRTDLFAAGIPQFSPVDLLMWEQDLGIWGAQFFAEQDLAVDAFSPFNNRRLLTTLLAAPRQLRVAPDFPLYRRLIEAMWPELLAFPFNPAPRLRVNFRDLALALRAQVRPYVPRTLISWLKQKGLS